MSKYSVKRPFTVLVCVVLIIVLGAASIYRMKMDLLPDMNLPYVLVITMCPGSSPEEVERNVTAPIEAAMATTSNISTIQSASYNSYSMVILEYEQSANMDSIVIEMQQKLDQVEGSFPTGVASPMIMQLDPTMLPIMVASADIEGMDPIQISDYVATTLVPYLESVEGVASVTTIGSVEERIEITLDEEKIKAINDDVMEQIREGFDEAQEELDEAKEQLEKGEKQLTQGQNQMAEQLSDGANQIVNGKIQAYVGEATIESTLATMYMIKPLLERAVTAAKAMDNNSALLRSNMDLVARYEALINSSLTDAELQQQTGMTREQLKAAVSSMKQIQETLQPNSEELKKAIEDLEYAGFDLKSLGITADMSNQPALSAQLSEGLATVNSTIATLEEAKKPLAEGKITIDDAYKK